MPQKKTKKTIQLSKSREDTERIAAEFSANIFKKTTSAALVVGLSGELGAGKTAFTQSIAKILGIKNKVSSPTFVIMKKYPIKNGTHDFLFHLDAYRLKNGKELLHLGWDEIIADPKNLIIIEWPENVIKVMPKHTHFVQISHTKEGHRSFQVSIS